MLTNRILYSVFGPAANDRFTDVWSIPAADLKIEPASSSYRRCLEFHDCCCLSKATDETDAVVLDILGLEAWKPAVPSVWTIWLSLVLDGSDGSDRQADIQLAVTFLSGRTVYINAKLADRIETIRSAILAAAGIQPKQQLLVFNGTALADGKMLADYQLLPDEPAGPPKKKIRQSKDGR
jgi:hypothetical protein